MAFKRVIAIGKNTTPFETYPKTASTAISLGQALKLSSGALTVAAGTDVPEFIAQSSSPATVVAEDIKVERITELDEYETTFSANGSSLTAGTKVTIATGGLQVTATATDGVFTLTTPGGASGSTVRGMFRR